MNQNNLKTENRNTEERADYCDFFRHALTNNIYTAGVANTANDLSCWWLIDSIMIYNTQEFKVQNPFQVWKYSRIAKSTCFSFECSDGNGNIIKERKILKSDFHGDFLKFYFVNNTLLLPEEY